MISTGLDPGGRYYMVVESGRKFHFEPGEALEKKDAFEKAKKEENIVLKNLSKGGKKWTV